MDALSSPNELLKKGIFTYETLGESLEDEIPYVIDGLITERSINMLAGDSGIGKTPLAVTIALSIAAGIPFLGMRVPRPRRVLYCDAESTRQGFHKVVGTLSSYMRLKAVPSNFHVWSPNWDETQMGDNYAEGLFSRAEWNGFKPEVIFIDPLRVFFPQADLKRDVALSNLKHMRRLNSGGSTWFIIHHTRKPSIKHEERPPAIEDNPHHWFHEVAGQHALVNHVDTRLGVELAPPGREGSEMTMGGFVRMLGPINPIFLARDYTDDGEPMGYMRASSLSLLKAEHQEAFNNLPTGGELFTFKLAAQTLGKSDSSCNNWLRRLQSIGAIKKIKGGYVRVIQ